MSIIENPHFLSCESHCTKQPYHMCTCIAMAKSLEITSTIALDRADLTDAVSEPELKGSIKL